MTKTKNNMYQQELEIAQNAQKIMDKPGISREELLEEYKLLGEKYTKLIKEIVKITRVSDMHYKKLIEANEQIQEHKNILEDLNHQLLEATAAKDKFYSIIAHDLRNPLQLLLFSSELMAEEYDKMSGDNLRKFVDKVRKTAQNMADLLENLLQWGRTQFGEIECRPQRVDLYPLAKETIDYFYENAEKKNIKVFLGILRSTWVFADQNMVRSTLRNLINNAIKFTNPLGTVTISSRDEGEFIAVSVTDTGVGIPEDKIGLLFNISEHYSTPGTAEERGSSLGLAICKEFVEKNQGEISVKSRVGMGSTFEFTLPKASS